MHGPYQRSSSRQEVRESVFSLHYNFETNRDFRCFLQNLDDYTALCINASEFSWDVLYTAIGHKYITDYACPSFINLSSLTSVDFIILHFIVKKISISCPITPKNLCAALSFTTLK